MSPASPESDYQNRIVAWARYNGWKVAHFRRAQRGGKWMTPVAADGAGFPDLVLTRAGRLIFAEVKAGSPVSIEQRQWLDHLEAVPGVEVYVWKLKDWHTVQDILKR